MAEKEVIAPEDTGAETVDPAVANAIKEQIDRLIAAPPRPRIPQATYRLQLNHTFTFDDAAQVVPYLAALGISDVYTSPQLLANPGSMHGYDVVDYGVLNAELGGPPAYDRFIAALQRAGMGQLSDFVPNHMGIAQGHNGWWLDVLENGEASPYARYFDIDWQPLKPELHGQVLLPVLGEHYGSVLENRELQLRFDDGAFTLWYYDSPFPIAPPTYPMILRGALDQLSQTLPADSDALLEYQSIITALERLPVHGVLTTEQIDERQREQIVAKRRLADLARSSPEVATAIAATVHAFNGELGNPASFDQLERLLEAQAYRLAYWRVAAEEINYRRFFAINELAAVRQEDPAVFAAAHDLTLLLLADGNITGLRIDHPDGLWDPAGYFADLQRGYLRAVIQQRLDQEAPAQTGKESDQQQDALMDAIDTARAEYPDQLQQPLYVIAEKILEEGEALPTDWAIAGTVGYDFLADVTSLFVNSANRRAFDELYNRFIRERLSYPRLVYEMKKLQMRVGFASEVNVLARALDRISEQNRRTRDFTLNNLRFALVETIACFPIYRTYLRCDAMTDLSEADRRAIESAIVVAKRRNPASDPTVFDFLRDTLLVAPDDLPVSDRTERCRFAMRFQQLTGPVMAKGVEDTVFYVYNRLVSLNEVGSDPSTFGIGISEFHRRNLRRQRQWPHAMLASSTHDTKRSEDVRARINVLSEIPRDWRAAVNRWSRLNRRQKTMVEGESAPSRNDEYLFYQTALGVWPLQPPGNDDLASLTERLVAYMAKATREAQVHTSWINPNQAYDEATERFVRGVLDPRKSEPFLTNFADFAGRVAEFGILNSLAQQLLKLTCPGVPDIYQGTELWDDSLVDPDNRRPVDYDVRRRLLTDLSRRSASRKLASKLLDQRADGRVKLYLTARTLAARQAHADLFLHGDYVPLEASGPAADHVCAFARRHGSDQIIVVVPRLLATMLRGEPRLPWGETIWGEGRLLLPPGIDDRRFRNVFTGETLTPETVDGITSLPLGQVFATFPVALLIARESSDKEG